jgi:hypothetical protein
MLKASDGKFNHRIHRIHGRRKTQQKYLWQEIGYPKSCDEAPKPKGNPE